MKVIKPEEIIETIKNLKQVRYTRMMRNGKQRYSSRRY